MYQNNDYINYGFKCSTQEEDPPDYPNDDYDDGNPGECT